MKKTLVFLVAVLILLSSCSIKRTEKESSDLSLPSLILEDTKYTLGQSGERPIFLECERLTFYSKDKYAIAQNFSFKQYDSDGELYIEGFAGRGEINTEAKTMTLSGNIELKQHRDGMEIQSENLYLDTVEEVLRADGKSKVKTTKGTISGYNLKGDLRNQVFSFDQIEQGVMEL